MSLVLKCLWDRNVPGTKTSLVPKCPGTEMSLGPKCPGTEMSMVPKCPGTEMSLGPKCPGAEMYLVPKCPCTEMSLGPKCPYRNVSCRKVWDRNVKQPLGRYCMQKKIARKVKFLITFFLHSKNKVTLRIKGNPVIGNFTMTFVYKIGLSYKYQW